MGLGLEGGFSSFLLLHLWRATSEPNCCNLLSQLEKLLNRGVGRTVTGIPRTSL